MRVAHRDLLRPFLVTNGRKFRCRTSTRDTGGLPPE
jgi:hypothetical protein